MWQLSLMLSERYVSHLIPNPNPDTHKHTHTSKKKQESIEKRSMSVRSLARISESLGPQRTRDELLPFVFEAEDEDEVLTELATQLGNMLAHVGGENYVDHLLSPLEALCATEDVSVRDRAVKSICSLMSNVPGSVHGKFFFPLLQRLAKKEWFAARSSSCGLLRSDIDTPTQKRRAR